VTNVIGGLRGSVQQKGPASETLDDAPGGRPIGLRSSPATYLGGFDLRRNSGRESGRSLLAQVFRSVCFFISITGAMANLPCLAAQQVTTPAPPPAAVPETLPDAPQPGRYPDAEPIALKDEGKPVSIESDTQTKQGSLFILDGNALVTYQNGARCTPQCTLFADHIEYNSDTGDVTMTGHVLVTGGENDERIHASHGTMNIRTQTGQFYDVSGSVGMRPEAVAKAGAKSGVATQPSLDTQPGAERMVYSNSNPFLFTGRLVVKTGPQTYDIYDGTVTSCQLPRPDWLLYAGKFNVDGTKARAKNSIFHLMNVPMLWLPYVTHPVDANDRQSGILIPTIGFGSASKGTTIGEQVYWAINRSTDLTAGTVYYSARGWSENGSFRYRGAGQDMARARYSALQDRGYTPSGGTYINQGGEEVTFSARRDEDGETRGVADIDYLSSFLYREGFTDSFNLAVSTDVLSSVYGTHEWDGMAASVEGDRYQGEKRVASTTSSGVQLPEEEVHIFHAPALEFTTTDHELGSTGLEWNVDSSAAGLKRSEPNFATSGVIERLDIHPELAYPFSLGGWRFRPSVAMRETFYSRSRFRSTPGGLPLEDTAPLNRTDGEVQVDVRAPVLERTFDSGWVKRLLKHDVKHTIEPEVTYRYVGGISNFQDILRFDRVDVASDTNEIQYGATQRLFLKKTGDKPCRAANSGANADEVLGPTEGAEGEVGEPVGVMGSAAAGGKGETAEQVCGNREWISWQLTQKYFFDPTFGGAVTAGPRSILDTTLAFSGIAFLTQPRSISPLLSRLRVRTSEKTDVEWDFDYDTGEKKFTSSNVYLDVHEGNAFGGISYAWLDAPARSYVGGVLSPVAEFSQMRVLAGFGKPTLAGPSLAANAGIDLNLGTVQYGAIQASYNWNCCGLSVEYRKYELGTARNENSYRFNFTLANIGTAGNLRRTQQVF
jgi:LPS-assembly protein